METSASLKKNNRTALLVIIAGLVLCFICMCMPAFTFTADVYTKKSGNTFVGDERYVAARAEVDAVAEEYRAQGFEVKLRAGVVERTNSKGAKTSLITFTLSESFQRSGFDVLFSGLVPSYMLSALVLFLLLALACAVGGIAGSMDVPCRKLDGRSAAFRTAACVCLVIAVLLVPVFFMTHTYALSREVMLYGKDLITEGKDAFYALLDGYLFNGAAGESIGNMLSGLSFSCTPYLWLIAPAAFFMLIAAIQLRHGTVKKTLLRGLLYTFVIVMCVFILYPYYVMLVTGFRSPAETNDMYFLHLVPQEWLISNIKNIIDRGVLTYLKNSVFIAGGATVIALLCGIPAAYAMARMNFKGRKLFLGFVIMSQMFSPVVLLIGITKLMTSLHLSDSILGLMFINAAFNQAFAIWLLRGTFISISPEMEQAGKIDGCTTLGSLWHILLPMAAPGIVTTLIFVFINSWNEYTVSTVLISTAANKPITVGVTTFSSFNMIEWQYLFAASLLATIPVVILFTCIEKHLTSGLTSGGVKG